jgi:FkbM family methyltransferase
MIKQLLAKNKIVQRVKAVKDLFLEKLDSLSHVQFEQIQKLEKLEKLEKLNQLDPLDFKVEQLNNSTEQIRQENAEAKRKADLSLENQAFLLKFSVDIIKNIQVLTEKLQTNHSQSQKQHESTLDTFQKIASDVRQDSQKHSDLILDSFQRIYKAYQQQSDAVFATIQKIQENLHQISEDNRQIFEDIHSQKYKVITDQQYFQDLDIELMTYLYSYLPHRLAVDIGANRGDVSSRLLQAGYQVYAFEPFPAVIDKLKNRLGDHPNFRLFPFALGSENQTQELHIATDETPDNTYQDASFYSSLTKHSLSEGLVFTDTISVTVKTLASLHDAEELPKDIGLVKIDTEGFDLEVIKGMGNYRYPVVVAEFWDQNFPFGRSGAMNQLPDLVNAMKARDYHWHLVIYRIWGSSDVSYYCNSAYSLDNSWGNVFFFQDYHVFHQALLWSASVMPATYFSA